MKFVSLKISGFKSFLEPIEIDLLNGLTGVVGPNGCGKSNIVEAIKWVMGENSAKQMRSNEMNNVIFSGTEKRPSRNFAEVSIKIDNSENKAPHPYKNISELEISRRIERDKGSTYKINGKISRARDVQLIFADTGTGSRSSSMVGQGKISEIIESKPENRKVIIEEAANITGLHNRKHEAELKLTSASINLERLDDIRKELSHQLKQLELQAIDVTRYKFIGEKIRKEEAALFFSQNKILETKKINFEDKIDKNLNLISEIQMKISVIERKKLDIYNQIPILKDLDNQNSNKLQDLKIKKATLEQKLDSILENKQNNEKQIEYIKTEILREKEIDNDSRKHIDNLNKDFKKLSDEGFNFTKDYEEAKNETIRLRQIMNSKNEELSTLNSKIIMFSSKKNNAEKEIASIKENNLKIEKQINSLKIDNNKKLITNKKKQQDNILKLIQNQKKLIMDKSEELNAINDSIVDNKNKKNYFEKKIDRLLTEIATIQSFLSIEEKDSLENKIDLNRNLEIAIGSVIGEALTAPIVKNKEIDKDHFWLENFNKDSKTDQTPLNTINLSEKTNNNHLLKNSLRGVGLVKTDEEAFRLQTKLEFGQALTTPKGGLWRWDGYVQKPNAKNSFTKRLLLKKKLLSLNKKLDDNHKKLEKIEIEIREDEILQEKLKRTLNEKEQLIKNNFNLEKKLSFEVSMAKSKIDSYDMLLNELKKNKVEGSKKLEFFKNEISEYDKLPALKAEEIKSRNLFENSKIEFEKAFSIEKQINNKHQFRKQNLDQIVIQIKNWQDRISESKTRIIDLSHKLKELNQNKEELYKSPKKLAEEIVILDGGLKEITEKQKISSDKLVIKETELREIEKNLKNEENKIAQLREDKVRFQTEHRTIIDNIKSLEDKTFEKLSMNINELFSYAEYDIEHYDKINESFLNNKKLKIDKLAKERESIGAVNLRVETEIEELTEKLNQMSLEHNDLSQAIEKLKSGIRELNKEGRERLINSFEKVNEKFVYLFKKLFNGGNAKLVLNGEDPLEAGLEIFASPPGKKMQSLSLLSGGEQALTSISLIFSVFLCNPSPVCILDEVDAALDDTNINNFCELLETLVKEQDIKFIIVTHHRLTMAKMNQLLGVTMQEKGISKLLTVDLEKAVKIKEAS